jgi:hypothetical protein
MDETERLVVEVLQGAISEAFQISERLDSKAASYLQIGGIWFAVVQVVAIPLLVTDDISRYWLWSLGAIGVVATVALALATKMTFGTLSLRDESAIDPADSERMMADVRRGADVSLALVQLLSSILTDRRTSNKTRAGELQSAAKLWGVAVTLALGELVFAVIERVFA